MKLKFWTLLAACLFLAIGAVAGGHGKDKGDKEHGHGHGPNEYASPHGHHHP